MDNKTFIEETTQLAENIKNKIDCEVRKTFDFSDKNWSVCNLEIETGKQIYELSVCCDKIYDPDNIFVGNRLDISDIGWYMFGLAQEKIFSQ